MIRLFLLILFGAALPPLYAQERLQRVVAVSSAEELRCAVESLIEGDTISIRAGIYEIDRPLLIDVNDVVVEGQGNGTRLVLTKGANCPVIFVGQDKIFPDRMVSGVTIRKLRIDGNRREQTSEHWRPPTPGGWFTNNCITFRQCRRCRVADVVVESAASGGIVFALECEAMKLERITARDNEFDGIAWGGRTSKSLILDSDCSKNVCAGISLDIGVHENSIRDTRCYDNGTTGLFMRESWSNSFEDCYFYNNVDGVFIADGDGVEVLGSKRNTFNRCSFIGNGRYGIWQCGENSCGNSLFEPKFRDNGEGDRFESFANEAPLLVQSGASAASTRQQRP